MRRARAVIQLLRFAKERGAAVRIEGVLSVALLSAAFATVMDIITTIERATCTVAPATAVEPAPAAGADAAGGFSEDWTWTPPFALGPTDDPTRLNWCRTGLASTRTEALTALAMTDAEGVVMAQLCLASDSGDFLVPAWAQDAVGMEIYRYYVLLIRAQTLSHTCA